MKFCIQRLLQGQYVRTTDLNRVLAVKVVATCLEVLLLLVENHQHFGFDRQAEVHGKLPAGQAQRIGERRRHTRTLQLTWIVGPLYRRTAADKAHRKENTQYCEELFFRRYGKRHRRSAKDDVAVFAVTRLRILCAERGKYSGRRPNFHSVPIGTKKYGIFPCRFCFHLT